VTHFHEVAREFVEDSVENVRGVLPLFCAASRDRAVCRFTTIVNTGQHCCLSYRMDLGLAAGVACRTIHWVYLVIQYSQVSYLLRSTEFCEWGGWYMGHDLALDWRCRCGNS
jgi:hypothetical protein